MGYISNCQGFIKSSELYAYCTCINSQSLTWIITSRFSIFHRVLVDVFQDFVRGQVESRFKFRFLRNGRMPNGVVLGQNYQTAQIIMNEI